MKKFLIVLVVEVLLLSDIYLATVIVKGKLAYHLPLKQTISHSLLKQKIDPKPTLLKFARLTAPLNKLPPLERTISDPTVVQKLYDTILTLPLHPTSSSREINFCTFPRRYEIHDQLSFYSDSKLLIGVTVGFSDCGTWVAIEGSDYNRDFNEDFLSLLASSIGVTKDELVGAK